MLQQIGDDYCYAQELFKQKELTGNLNNTLKTHKSIYQRVVYGSAGVKRKFTEDLRKNETVKVYSKLPSWFTVPTPPGTYNPDRAVLMENDGLDKIYFVVETKGSRWWDHLSHKEGKKSNAGFSILANKENPGKYIKATNVADALFTE